jgi:hypothetical protein
MGGKEREREREREIEIESLYERSERRPKRKQR